MHCHLNGVPPAEVPRLVGLEKVIGSSHHVLRSNRHVHPVRTLAVARLVATCCSRRVRAETIWHSLLILTPEPTTLLTDFVPRSDVGSSGVAHITGSGRQHIVWARTLIHRALAHRASLACVLVPRLTFHNAGVACFCTDINSYHVNREQSTGLQCHAITLPAYVGVILWWSNAHATSEQLVDIVEISLDVDHSARRLAPSTGLRQRTAKRQLCRVDMRVVETESRTLHLGHGDLNTRADVHVRIVAVLIFGVLIKNVDVVNCEPLVLVRVERWGDDNNQWIVDSLNINSLEPSVLRDVIVRWLTDLL